jgi:hypothetical protein
MMMMMIIIIIIIINIIIFDSCCRRSASSWCYLLRSFKCFWPRSSYCKLLIFADDLKIVRVINSPHDCLLLQSDIDSMSDWCIC